MLDAECKLADKPSDQPESAVSGSSPANNEGVVRKNELGSVAIEPSRTRVADRKATGPRTEMGKRKASANATKYAIFSKAIVLKGESRGEHESIVAEWQKDLKAVSPVQKLLVEKLVSIAWRERRIDVAEAAEILKRREFYEWDQQSRIKDQQNRRQDWPSQIFEGLLKSTPILIQRINNKDVLKTCLSMLSELKRQIEDSGFNPDVDAIPLKAIYGNRDPDLRREDLYGFYVFWENTAEASEEEREREGYISPEQCKQKVIREIAKEMRYLKGHQRQQAAVEADRTQFEILSRNIPDASVLDLFSRYRTSLGREFDRVLAQLERLQRMQSGQMVPPQ